ncbi:MAG: hypothetical protein U9Q22_02620 [Candidatus Altiarchaeota archaeon]|nr:hypothetical protein [Candidatus Altiarchaeota archaeon]
MESKSLGIMILVVCVVLIGFSILWTKTPEKEPVVKPTPTTVVKPPSTPGVAPPPPPVSPDMA